MTLVRGLLPRLSVAGTAHDPVAAALLLLRESSRTTRARCVRIRGFRFCLPVRRPPDALSWRPHRSSAQTRARVHPEAFVHRRSAPGLLVHRSSSRRVVTAIGVKQQCALGSRLPGEAHADQWHHDEVAYAMRGFASGPLGPAYLCRLLDVKGVDGRQLLSAVEFGHERGCSCRSSW
jgi:hypothetical protein